jgi:hypothetical protein
VDFDDVLLNLGDEGLDVVVANRDPAVALDEHASTVPRSCSSDGR